MSNQWIPVSEQLPETNTTVLAVKELKSGQRQICIAHCIRDYEHYDPVENKKWIGPYWVCGGNNNIIYWMALPEIPAKGGSAE